MQSHACDYRIGVFWKEAGLLKIKVHEREVGLRNTSHRQGIGYQLWNEITSLWKIARGPLTAPPHWPPVTFTPPPQKLKLLEKLLVKKFHKHFLVGIQIQHHFFIHPKQLWARIWKKGPCLCYVGTQQLLKLWEYLSCTFLCYFASNEFRSCCG